MQLVLCEEDRLRFEEERRLGKQISPEQFRTTVIEEWQKKILNKGGLQALSGCTLKSEIWDMFDYKPGGVNDRQSSCKAERDFMARFCNALEVSQIGIF
jgi:hypothetical protein